MRKLMLFVVCAGLLAGQSIVLAADMKMAEGKEMMCGKDCMCMKDKAGMCSKMMGQMGMTMVATENGGVIVLAGNKLMKFDKDLAMIKEVEIKMDMAKMKEEMEGCAMGKKGEMMKEGAGVKEGAEKEMSK
jgi:hypothetical protein